MGFLVVEFETGFLFVGSDLGDIEMGVSGVIEGLDHTGRVGCGRTIHAINDQHFHGLGAEHALETELFFEGGLRGDASEFALGVTDTRQSRGVRVRLKS